MHSNLMQNALNKGQWIWLPGALIILALGCATSKPRINSQEEIKTILTEQGKAWNRGDIVGFMKAYEPTDALLFTSGGQFRRGYDETLAKYQAKYGEPGAMGKLDFTVIDFRQLGAKSAVMLGSWKLTETPKAGGGLFTLVWLKTPDGWKIVHDHTSLGPRKETP